MGLAAPVLGSLRQGEAAAEKAQIQAQSLLLGARPRHDDSTNDHSKGAGPVPAGLAERSPIELELERSEREQGD